MGTLLEARDTARFSIEVAAASLSRAKHGTIFVRIGGTSFPDDAWWDFPATLLSWWSETIVSLRTGCSEEGICRFMDGPYWFEFHASGGLRWQVRLIEDRRRRRRVLEAEVDPHEVVTELLRACDTIASRCRDQGWQTPDTTRLESFRDRLTVLSITDAKKRG